MASSRANQFLETSVDPGAITHAVPPLQQIIYPPAAAPPNSAKASGLHNNRCQRVGPNTTAMLFF